MLAYASTYHIKDVIAALQSADSYRKKSESTGKSEFIDIVVDSELARDLAALTDHQQLVLSLRWTVGFTLEETGRLIGVSAEAVRQSELAAKNKIEAVLLKWGKQS